MALQSKEATYFHQAGHGFFRPSTPCPRLALWLNRDSVIATISGLDNSGLHSQAVVRAGPDMQDCGWLQGSCVAFMDAERHMFEKQLSAAEDAAKTATTRLRKVQDAANRLENDVASLKEKTTADVATLRQKLDQALSSVQRALDQQDGTPTGAVAGGGAAPSAEQTDRLEGTSCDEVDMWTGRYLNGRSAFCPRSRLPSPPRCCRTA